MIRTKKMAANTIDNDGHDISDILEMELHMNAAGRPKPVGRPPSGKIMVNLRLDPDVVARFKATGKGWQARINEALRKV